MSCIVTERSVFLSMTEKLQSVAEDVVGSRPIEVRKIAGGVLLVDKSTTNVGTAKIRPVSQEIFTNVRAAVNEIVNTAYTDLGVDPTKLPPVFIPSDTRGTVSDRNYEAERSIEITVRVPPRLVELIRQKAAADLANQAPLPAIEAVEEVKEPELPQEPNVAEVPKKPIKPISQYKGYPNTYIAPFQKGDITIIPWGNQYIFEGEVYPSYADALRAERESAQDQQLGRDLPFSKLDKVQKNKLAAETAEALMKFLESKFPGIKSKIINDPSQKWRGKLEDLNTPVINLAYAEISDGFHEFAHPFLMALRKSNKALFEKLANDLQNAPEWKEIFERAFKKTKSLYPELSDIKNLAYFKEEVLATAIGYAAEKMAQEKEAQVSANLSKVIDSIFKWLNEFFSEFFAKKVNVATLSPTTTFGQVIDMFTDVRTQIILTEDWNVLTELETNVDEMSEVSQSSEDMIYGMFSDIREKILTTPSFDLNEYINNWLDTKLKLPKKDYLPRNYSPSEYSKTLAAKIIKRLSTSTGFQLNLQSIKGKTKQLPAKKISESTVERLAEALDSIQFKYKFSFYLDGKKTTSIPLNQPFVNIREVEVTDKATGEKRLEQIASVPMTLYEAEVVGEFQKYVLSLYPNQKSIPANELNDLYLEWVTDNYGLNAVEARGHVDYGIQRISTEPATSYKRTLFIDDYFHTQGHKFQIPKINTNDAINGIGWYVSAVIDNDKFDHEFQSDILPEIHKSFLLGQYEGKLDESAQKEFEESSSAEALARTHVLKMLEHSGDFLLGNMSINNYVLDRTTPLFKKIVNQGVPLDSLSNSENQYTESALSHVQDYLISELEVSKQRLLLENYSLNEFIFHKIYHKIADLALGRKTPEKAEFEKWINTVVSETTLFSSYSEATAYVDSFFAKDLPFSKTEEFIPFTYTFQEVYSGYNHEYHVTIHYITKNTIENIPSFIKEQIEIRNNWSRSNSIVRPNSITDEAAIKEILEKTFRLFLAKGKLAPNYGHYREKLLGIRRGNKKLIESTLTKYKAALKKAKAIEWREKVYANPNNIAKLLNYYNGQYARLYKFYETVQKDIKDTQFSGRALDSNYEIYKKYNQLYSKWFSIIIAHSINTAKLEGHSYYYLPTAEAMNAVEGNTMAEKVYMSPYDIGTSENSDFDVVVRFVENSTSESIIAPYLSSEFRKTLGPWTSAMDVAEEMVKNDFLQSDTFKDYKKEIRKEVPQVGPFYLALSKYASKHKIKLSYEQPNWAKEMLIKVDLSNYQVTPIERFSKLEEEPFVPVKEGVPELFESNPELANAVYEVLGFKPTINNSVYSAVFFNTDEVTSKYKQVHPNLYSHHSTIQFKPSDISNLPIGNVRNIKIVGRLTTDKVDVLIVENPLSTNKFPHITLSTAEGVKPFESNSEIEKNQSKIQPVNDTIQGTVGVFDGKSEITSLNLTPQQKQQAQQLYYQYLDSLNKPNTNPILQGNQQEQVKKFAELQERLNNKEFLEGAKSAYESTPALQQLGTQEEYNDYIARVSLGIIKNPSSGEYNYTSKVKDIVYHGSGKKIEQFKDEFKGSENSVFEDNPVFDKLGFFFTPDIKAAKQYGNIINFAVVNSNNLQKVNFITELLDNKKINNNADSYIGVETTETYYKDTKTEIGYQRNEIPYDTIIIKNSEQIHILGSKQDIEGFKKFVAGTKVATAVSAEITEESLAMDIQEAIDNVPQIDSRDLDDIGFEGEVCGI